MWQDAGRAETHSLSHLAARNWWRPAPQGNRAEYRLVARRMRLAVWIVLTPAERGGDMGENRFHNVSAVFHAQLIWYREKQGIGRRYCLVLC